MSSAKQCYVSAENARNMATSGNSNKSLISSPAPRHRPRASSSGGFTLDTPQFRFSPRYKRCSRAKTCIRHDPKVGSSSCRCTTTLTGTITATKMYVNKIQLVSHPMSSYFLKDDGVFSDQEMKKSGVKAYRTSQM